MVCFGEEASFSGTECVLVAQFARWSGIASLCDRLRSRDHQWTDNGLIRLYAEFDVDRSGKAERAQIRVELTDEISRPLCY